jgi:hypothetical protein
MDALPQIPQSWVNGLFAALAGVCLWLFRKHDKKLDSIGDTYVTRKELADAIAVVMAAIQKANDTHDTMVRLMHSDNSRNFDALRTELQGVNNKLFDLAGRIPVK